MPRSGDHAVLEERFVRDLPKWQALKSADTGAAGVVTDVVLIDDHDASSRAQIDVGGGRQKTVFMSHLKICRLIRGADGNYSLTSTPGTPVMTDEGDASA